MINKKQRVCANTLLVLTLIAISFLFPNKSPGDIILLSIAIGYASFKLIDSIDELREKDCDK